MFIYACLGGLLFVSINNRLGPLSLHLFAVVVVVVDGTSMSHIFTPDPVANWAFFDISLRDWESKFEAWHARRYFVRTRKMVFL